MSIAVSRNSEVLKNPWLGQLVAERFRVLRQGSVASVCGQFFVVEDSLSGKECDFFVLSSPQLDLLGFNALVQLMHEVLTPVQQLKHENIEPLLAYGVYHGAPYLVWETNSEVWASFSQLPVGATRDNVLSWIKQVFVALDYAHSQLVTHLGLVPADILLHPNQEGDLVVRLRGFGVKNLLCAQENELSLITRHSMTLGDPRYMAPEQFAGKKVDAKTDLYAMGAIIYELIVGAPPFRAQALIDLMLEVLNDPVPPPQFAPHYWSRDEKIKALAMQLLEKSPSLRPDSARQCLEKLATADVPAESFALPVSGTELLRDSSPELNAQHITEPSNRRDLPNEVPGNFFFDRPLWFGRILLFSLIIVSIALIYFIGKESDTSLPHAVESAR